MLLCAVKSHKQIIHGTVSAVFGGIMAIQYTDSETNQAKNTINTPVQAYVRIVTFGRFDIFVNGTALDFHNSKAKELLALCIDRRGGTVTIEDAVDNMWPEKCYDECVKRLYRKAVIYIRRTLEQAGIPELFVRSRGCCCIRTDLVDCDYYRFLENPAKNLHMFRGEYMINYSWAEGTLAWLEKRSSGYIEI